MINLNITLGKNIYESKTQLNIGDVVWSINCIGIDYILYPKEEMIQTGEVSEIYFYIKGETVVVKGYKVKYSDDREFSYFPINIGTYIFTSKEELITHYDKLRELHFRMHPNQRQN